MNNFGMVWEKGSKYGLMMSRYYGPAGYHHMYSEPTCTADINIPAGLDAAAVVLALDPLPDGG